MAVWFQRNFIFFFENATKILEISENSYVFDTDGNEINSIRKAIKRYRNHSNVLLIKLC